MRVTHGVSLVDRHPLPCRTYPAYSLHRMNHHKAGSESFVNRNKPEGCECETMKFVTPDELFAQSDVIVLCAPGSGKPIVDAESIAKMKDGVVIINVSRGANVDEAALLDALNSGKVRAAGIDVLVDEKNPNWELASHPAVSCTPHVGAGTKEAQKRIGAELVDIIRNF